MSLHASLWIMIGAGVLSALGCTRNGDREVGAATITSAPPRPVATEPKPVSWPLVHELCKRRASCIERGAEAGSSIGAVASAECIQQERPRLEKEVASWNCAPAAERARLEQCLASLQVTRCEPILASNDQLPLCRANVGCGPHAEPER